MKVEKVAQSRIAALDLTKGALVVIMVLYHSFNYSTQRRLGYEYLGFLPPSFILITGFLVSNVYLARYAPSDSRLVRRLLARGGKLLLTFTALNVASISLFHSRARGEMPGLSLFFERWFDTYVTGNGRIASFEVLPPLAYLLLVAPLLLWINSLHRFALPALTLAAVATLIALEQSGIAWANVQLLSAGLVGMLLGRLPMPVVNRLGRFWWGAVIAYAACFWLTVEVGEPYPLQPIVACVALALIFSLCLRMNQQNRFVRRLEILGQYSLVAYIAQIGILQILTRAIGRSDPVSLPFLCLFIGALALTSVSVEIVCCARSRFQPADAAYKAVFV